MSDPRRGGTRISCEIAASLRVPGCSLPEECMVILVNPRDARRGSTARWKSEQWSGWKCSRRLRKGAHRELHFCRKGQQSLAVGTGFRTTGECLGSPAATKRLGRAGYHRNEPTPGHCRGTVKVNPILIELILLFTGNQLFGSQSNPRQHCAERFGDRSPVG